MADRGPRAAYEGRGTDNSNTKNFEEVLDLKVIFTALCIDEFNIHICANTAKYFNPLVKNCI